MPSVEYCAIGVYPKIFSLFKPVFEHISREAEEHDIFEMKLGNKPPCMMLLSRLKHVNLFQNMLIHGSS